MYKMNYDGQLRYKYASEEFIWGLTMVAIVYSFIIGFAYLSVGIKFILYFYLMVAIILVVYSVRLFGFVRMLKRQNKTISEVSFAGDSIVLRTDKILWLEAKEFQQNKDQVHFKDRKFTWYGKKSTEKEGLSIFINGVELFLVKDYFDEYEDVKKILL